jgi:hypothetical protein
MLYFVAGICVSQGCNSIKGSLFGLQILVRAMSSTMMLVEMQRASIGGIEKYSDASLNILVAEYFTIRE